MSVLSEGTRQEIAEKNTILRFTVGSKLHGLNLPGRDDTDEMAVYVEPPEFVIGLRSLEHVVVRTQPEGMPSGPGDLDLSMYSLRKFVSLALSGNPTILLMFFAPIERAIVRRTLGTELQGMAPYFMAKTVAEPFLGYLEAQRQRFTGERGGRPLRKPGNAHWNEAVGYDTKYAMHMLRLGYQGIEVLKTGRIVLPVPQPANGFLMAVRRGEVTKDEVLTTTGQLEREIKDLRLTSPLQDRPDEAVIEDWLVRSYLRDRSWV